MPGSRFVKTYLPVLWIAMSVLVFASDSEDDEKEPESNSAAYAELRQPETKPAELDELRRIADEAFPLDPYDPIQERELSHLGRADAAMQTAPMVNVPSAILFKYIFPCMVPEELLCLKETCSHFSQLLRLNGYCLTETRVPNIPAGLLRAKVCTTQDGILRLASLMNVCPEDLAKWFEPAFLRAAFFRYRGVLPPQLVGQSEEVLERLYPVIKVVLAARLVNKNNLDENNLNENNPEEPTTAESLRSFISSIRKAFTLLPEKDPVIKLLDESPHEKSPEFYELSFNSKRLLLQLQSLNAPQHKYYEILAQLIKNDRPSSSQKIAIMGRKLLMAGEELDTVRNRFFSSGTAEQKSIALQIFEWRLRKLSSPSDNPLNQKIRQAFRSADNLLSEVFEKVFLFGPALSVGQLDFIRDFLRNTFQLPNNENTVVFKILASLARECGEPETQSSIQQFVETLYASHWRDISPDLKFTALRLLIQGERRAEVQKAMGDLLQLMDPSQYDRPYKYNGIVLKAWEMFKPLSRHRYDEELRALTDRFRNIGIEHLIPALCSSHEACQDAVEIGDVCAQTIKIDRKWSIDLLSAFVTSDQTNIQNKLDAFSVLAEHAPEEAHDLVSHIHSLNYTREDFEEKDFASDLCGIYYELKDRERCAFYYPGLCQELARIPDIIKTLQDRGLPVQSIEDLLKRDPFEVLPILELITKKED